MKQEAHRNGHTYAVHKMNAETPVQANADAINDEYDFSTPKQTARQRAGVGGAGRAGGSGESVFLEDVVRPRFRLVLRRSASPLSMIERGTLAFLKPG